jgi:hypothetical protein
MCISQFDGPWRILEIKVHNGPLGRVTPVGSEREASRARTRILWNPQSGRIPFKGLYNQSDNATFLYLNALCCFEASIVPNDV